MKNLFVFGLGFSSLHFVRHHTAGWNVSGSVRSTEKMERLHAEGIEALIFSSEQADPKIADKIMQADALIISVPPDTQDPVLHAYADVITRAPNLKRIVYLSTVGVYGDHQGAWVDEDTIVNPVSLRSVQRVQAEQAWRELDVHGDKVDVLRLAGIYGPGRNALVQIKQGTSRRIIKPGQIFNRIHVEDIARAIDASLKGQHVGRIWNVTDDEPAPPQDVVSFAADLLQVPAPAEVPFETAQMTPMARSFYSESKRVSNKALREVLGVELAFPTYREGLRNLLPTVL